jgi:hypothetical protein
MANIFAGYINEKDGEFSLSLQGKGVKQEDGSWENEVIYTDIEFENDEVKENTVPQFDKVDDKSPHLTFTDIDWRLEDNSSKLIMVVKEATEIAPTVFEKGMIQNQINVSGNVGNDFRTFGSNGNGGSIAVSQGEDTVWLDVTAWMDDVDLTKGKTVTLENFMLTPNKYTNKDGVDICKIIAHSRNESSIN